MFQSVETTAVIFFVPVFPSPSPCSSFHMELEVLKAILMLVSLSMYVIYLILYPRCVNVVHFF